MTTLKPGTLCVIVGGCPENIGLVVEVLEHIGPFPPRADAYRIRTVTGRNFPQLKIGSSERLEPGYSSEAITDRHKLGPLVSDDGDSPYHRSVERPSTRQTDDVKFELNTCNQESGMRSMTISPFTDHLPAPIDDPNGSFPYIVIRLIATVYQKESLQVRVGSPDFHIGYRSSFVQHPCPYAENGSISPECRAYMLTAVLEAVIRLRFRMCVVWKKGACTFVEPDGQFNDSDEAPSGGVVLPNTIEYDRRTRI